jgi:hypothetical protein
MPFKSDSQRKLCYLLKGKGQAGSWDCDEWSTATGKKKLPEHVEDQTEKDALEATNKIKGGEGDNKKPSDFPRGVLDEGAEEEKEHTNDPDMAREIAIDHLAKDPNYYTKLKKVEKAGSLEAFNRLYNIWAAASPVKTAAMHNLLSKLSSVITSPGRGSGDEEETSINPDSSEGMQIAKPVKPVPGKMSFNQKGLKPVAPLGAARNAVRRVTENEFGFDPASGVKEAQSMFSLWKNIPGTMYRSMFGNGPRVPRDKKPKKDWELSDFAEEYPELKGLNFQDLYRQSEQRVLERAAKEQFHGSPESLYAGNRVLSKKAGNFDFSSLGTKLDPSLIGGAKQAPSIRGTAPANGFDFSNINKSLTNTGKMLGRAATSGVESWVKAPGFSNPGEVWKRRNQALGAQKAIGSVTDSAGKAIAGAQRLGSNFLSAGGTLMGMGKQSNIQSTTGGSAIAPKAAAPSAPAAISPKIAAPKAAAPSAPSNNGNAFSGAASGVGDAFRAGFGNQDALKRVQDDLNRPNYSQLNNTVNGLSDAFGGVGKQMQGAYGAAKTLFRSPPPNPNPGFLEKAKAQATAALNKGRLAVSVARDPLGWRRAGQTADWAKRLGSGLTDSYNTAKAQAANSEGRRMAAGVTMPVLNFMQNNPWAKYLIGAAGVGAAGYGLSRMFGGGQQQEQQPQAGSIFQQSYNQGLKGA